MIPADCLGKGQIWRLLRCIQGPVHRCVPVNQWKVADVVAFLQTIELGHLWEAIKDNGVGELQRAAACCLTACSATDHGVLTAQMVRLAGAE